MNNYFTLQPLTGPRTSDVHKTFKRAAEILGPAKERATLQFRILGAPDDCFTISLDADGAKSEAGRAVKHPDFEIITRSETWMEIADGTLAPLRAFTEGRMRVRGDIELGQALFARLAKNAKTEHEGK